MPDEGHISTRDGKCFALMLEQNTTRGDRNILMTGSNSGFILEPIPDVLSFVHFNV